MIDYVDFEEEDEDEYAKILALDDTSISQTQLNNLEFNYLVKDVQYVGANMIHLDMTLYHVFLNNGEWINVYVKGDNDK